MGDIAEGADDKGLHLCAVANALAQQKGSPLVHVGLCPAAVLDVDKDIVPPVQECILLPEKAGPFEIGDLGLVVTSDK